MKLPTKLVILVVAVLLTLIGFNALISSSALELAKVGKQAGNEIIANYLMRLDAVAPRTPSIKG